MTRQFCKRYHCVLLGLVLLGLAGTALAAPVTLNLRNADINKLVESISFITGKNFIVDPRVKGRVSIISTKPMDESEIYEVFLSVLAVHGFAAVPGERVTKIVPSASAKQENIPTLETPTSAEDQVVTRVIQVRNVSAAQIVPILRPLIPPQGHLAAYAPTNVLIVSDAAGNVQRIADIISRVDQASDEAVEIVPLQYASASEIVRVLTALQQGQGRARGQAAAGVIEPSQLVADERTNSILMTGDPTSRLRLRTLITHLDTPLEGTGNTQVIYLRYAKATELVEVLTGVSERLSEEEQLAGPAEGQLQQARTRPQAPRRVPRAVQRAGAGTEEIAIDIQADEATNALVITAPPEAIRALKQVIAQLDIRRAQVLVEAAIAEISAERVADLGIQWVVDGSRDGNIVGFTNFTLSQSLAAVAGAIFDFTENETVPDPGNIGTGLTTGVGSFSGSTRFAALISALSGDSDTNVLSTPTLVALDNEQAEIVVGENRPFLTGSFTTSASGATNPFQTIERRDVALTLRVTPQINEGNSVQLEIEQDIENVLEVSAQGPVTSKRSIKTNVLVEDGQILVLGGLIDDQLSETSQKVPGLGDIPIIGEAFRFRSTTKRKRNLMIFLHPVILRDPQLGTLYTNDKYSYIRQQQIQARQIGGGLLPKLETPKLVPPEQVKQQKSMLNVNPEANPDRPVEPAEIGAEPPKPEPRATTTPLFYRRGYNNR